MCGDQWLSPVTQPIVQNATNVASASFHRQWHFLEQCEWKKWVLSQSLLSGIWNLKHLEFSIILEVVLGWLVTRLSIRNWYLVFTRKENLYWYQNYISFGVGFKIV
jgi:hypothetical protein